MFMFIDLERNGLTQSILLGFLRCRVFSKLSLEGWTPLKTGGALQYGTLAHNVLEKVYGATDSGFPEENFIHRTIESCSNSWIKENGGRLGKEEMEQIEMNCALLDAVLPEYFKFWKDEDFKKINWIALEEEFNFPYKKISGVNITLRGKYDGLYKVGKEIYLFETKTKGQIDERTLSELLAFDFQTDFYSLAIKQKYGKFPSGVRYNIIRRPANKPHKSGESLNNFSDRIREEVRKNPCHYFVRYKISKSISDLNFFEAELEKKIREFYLWNIGKLETYRNENSCIGRYGACRFLPICSQNNYKGFFKRKNLFSELKKEVV